MNARLFLPFRAIFAALLLAGCKKDSGSDSSDFEGKISALRTEVSSLRSKVGSVESALRDVDRSLHRSTNATASARQEITLLKEEVQLLRKELAKPQGQHSHVKLGELPFGTPIAGKPGKIKSPYAPDKGLIDVEGYSRGTLIECPFSGMQFRAP